MNTPLQCPGLDIGPAGVLFVDSIGRTHDLETDRRYSPGEAAISMKRSPEWVLREIRARNLYPVIYHNERSVELYDCAIKDYYARKLGSMLAAVPEKGTA